ncbi:MAG: hypothetical protein JGK17_20210 [Microcoleus sp. PH2017_10_PVI_O_A]|uniref:hypothetical protein n=1 Tax=unclassified Microcoleus TaxID=2642155 RepID=UPI001D74907F|nr:MULTISPECIES: hypothetical protein [unclassified Microcoleus]MCC3561960.1 hypothetical protein [Microcoleus sp. PH2017_27_LUM_O_A]TAE79208.1 MAG: hypothetical protein EAZ83_22270 [Oscillatoriales cyanobacterium]MCC3407871.1 hypothetical protein [Microcoleus sp. PH2017_10_PVI_O_A]MCC3462568.1 hypothetical protein [Microcoleus sp. PH2017_11_PCY_U_A]MCC3480989.1 hypothetical protein [Microcoleus sp. PH2017_12_PCY_D_A]
MHNNLRNRVSSDISRTLPKIVAETRFLATYKVLVHNNLRNRVSSDISRTLPKIVAETRFLATQRQNCDRPRPKSSRLPTDPPGVINPRLIGKVLLKRTEKHNFQQPLSYLPSRLKTDLRSLDGDLNPRRTWGQTTELRSPAPKILSLTHNTRHTPYNYKSVKN